jgi:Domain of unknown function (DUF3425)
MLSTFVCMSWQMMTAWHTYTRAHVPCGSLMTWRVHPTVGTFMKIPICYQPSKMQLTVLHPAIIDWIPWPALRNKLIQYHSANPRLDDIICDIGTSYCAEADLSTLVAGITPVLGYVGVWDLVRSIAPDTTADIIEVDNSDERTLESYYHDLNQSDPLSTKPSNPEQDHKSSVSLPASSVSNLFGSRELALQAFKALGMDEGASTFRLDPLFFERHPELYDCESDLMARGVPLRPTKQNFVPLPRPLNSCTLNRYRELSRWNSAPPVHGYAAEMMHAA